MRRGQESPADKSLKRPAREARSGRKALLAREKVTKASALPLNIELLRKMANNSERYCHL